MLSNFSNKNISTSSKKITINTNSSTSSKESSPYTSPSKSNSNTPYKTTITISSNNDTSKVSSEEYTLIQREKRKKEIELKSLLKTLRHRLYVRPNDVKSLYRLCIEVYQQGDLFVTILLIRYIKLCNNNKEEVSGDIQLMLGKTYFRRYMKDRYYPHSSNEMHHDLKNAVLTYKEAVKSPDLRKRNASPLPHFELASIQLRRGSYQSALDSIGVALVIFNDPDEHFEWMVIGHYISAQISLIIGETKQGLKLYRDVLCCPRHVQVDTGNDSILLLTTRVLNVLVSIEIARLHQKDNDKYYLELYREIYERMKKPGASKDYDLSFGTKSFEEWYYDYKTFQTLGEMFKNENNFYMAGEMYSVASELYLKKYKKNNSSPNSYKNSLLDNINTERSELNDYMNNAQMREYLSMVLDSAEAYAEFHCFEESEQRAHYAYHSKPNDVVVIGRAGRCVRHTKENAEYIRESRIVIKSVFKIQGMLKRKVAIRRRKEAFKIGLIATKIISFFRMVLVRNRTIGFRLGAIPCMLIPYLIKKLDKKLLKTGKEHLSNWTELWHLSITPLQRLVRLFLRKRAFKKFWGGVKKFKRVFLGQLTRRKLRKEIEDIQLFFDTNPSLDDRIEFEKNYKFLFFRGINFKKTVRISCGISNTNLNVEHNDTLNITNNTNTAPFSPDNSDIGTGSTFNVTSPPLPIDSLVEPKARNFRSLPPIQHPEEKSLLSPVKIDYSKVPMTKSSKLRHDAKKAKSSKTMAILTPLKVPTAHGKFAKAGVAWFQNSKKSPKSSASTSTSNIDTLPKAQTFNLSDSTLNDTVKNFNDTNMLANMNKFKKSIVSNDDELRSENDLISLISFKSVSEYHPIVQWAPFGILPDSAILRLLTCTILSVTSPSFTANDAKRICKIVSNIGNVDNDLNPWYNIRSLLVYSTKMGASGLNNIISLGINHLTSLSLGYIGMNHICGSIIGKQIMNTYDGPSSVISSKDCRLMKLFIEGEMSFGDRGAVEIFKCLQFNNTLKILSIRDCGLSNRTAVAASRSIVINQTLDTIILNDNNFTYNDALLFIRAVANKGGQGPLRFISLRDQTPLISNEQMEQLYKIGSDLMVRVVANELDVVMETENEIHGKNDGDDYDHKYTHHLASLIKDYSNNFDVCIEKAKTLYYQKKVLL